MEIVIFNECIGYSRQMHITRNDSCPFLIFLLGFDDHSPEEVRLKAYEAQASGQIDGYVSYHLIYIGILTSLL